MPACQQKLAIVLRHGFSVPSTREELLNASYLRQKNILLTLLTSLSQPGLTDLNSLEAAAQAS